MLIDRADRPFSQEFATLTDYPPPRDGRDDDALRPLHCAEAWLRLLRALAAAQRCLRQLLSESPAAVLREVEPLALLLADDAGDQGIGQSLLAESLGISPAQASGLTERLRTAGLLAAHRPHGDRRRQLWRVTATGRRRLAESLAQLLPAVARIEGQRHADHARQLTQQLEQLIEGLAAPPRNKEQAA